ncbi:hypothetical protein [Corynebacterium sp. TAE3-ERU2]|uniref:hypothetical protein n=1 Tax=Corynebacterium sp. TAE3-ERU2 TaxID=2849497 RepID=UPI001C473B74|nr:hypothetical protein [Corynebacterium sp. TAE3-ERU2]MBV7302521.1 hypothetical protein [Corynebacterium sp. TAE3-ERU2]
MSISTRQRPVRASLAIAASVVLLGAAGCSSNEDDAVTTASSEASSSVSSADSSAETSTEATEGNAESNDECAVDPNADVVHRAVAQINQEEGSWSFKGDSNWNACTDLTYARVDEADKPIENAESVLLLFHAGEYVGRDEGSPHMIEELKADPEGYSIDVTYRDGQGGDKVLLYWNEQDNAVGYQRSVQN